MKKTLGRIISLCMCLSLICSSAAFPQAFAAPDTGGEERQAYEIYPTPHEIVYAESDEVVLPEKISAVFESGIDSYTVTRAQEAFAQAGISLEQTDTAGSGISLLVGIKGSGGAADTYFSAKNLTDEALFAKSDAYQLVINADGIVILGVNTDAAFYGLTTVKHILSQTVNRTVRSFSIKDYSDVAFRGFIEGYYGNPWANEDRADLMKFGGELKMNIYFYAPKDDPKHNSKWREMYTPDELEKIKALAEAGEQSKCRYGYALHPFMNNPVRFDANYDTDLQLVKDKFLQVIRDAGVRQIAVLADDAGVPQGNAANYVRMMKDLTDWLESDDMQSRYQGLQTSIPFCPNDYMGNGSSNQHTVLRQLPESVPVIMTGGKVWGEVSNSFVNSFYSNTGRGPFLWINWPCTDNSKSHLIMGGHKTFLQKEVSPDKIKGIMLNPMQQSEPSKVAIFCNAVYAWNIWETDEQADQAWYDSFKYVDHVSAAETDASAALRELSKHMINQNMDTRVTKLEESLDLAPLLSDFRSKMDSGTLTQPDIEGIKREMQMLHAAAVLYREQGQERLAGQIQYWLDSWTEVTQGNLDLLEALSLILKGGDSATIVQKYVDGQALLSAAKTHKFWYVDHWENAEVGVQHLVPFSNALLSKVAETAQTIIDPTKLIPIPITNRTDTPTGALGNMIDGNLNTEAIFKTPASISVGTYVGVRYNRAIPMHSVRFELGRTGNAGDTFAAAKLQYTEDGTAWLDIPDAAFTGTPAVLEKTGLNLNAKGIRAVATAEKGNTWLGVREIYVNRQADVPDGPETLTGTPFKTDNVSIRAGTLNNMLDGSLSTDIQLARAPYEGDNRDQFPAEGAVGLDLGQAKEIGSITITQDNRTNGGDKMSGAVLEYSLDGSTYVPIKSNINENQLTVAATVNARYIRLRNTQQTNGWVRIAEFAVRGPDPNAPIAPRLMKTSGWAVYQAANNPESNLFDGNDSTYVWYDLTAAGDRSPAGDFIGVDLGRSVPLGRVHFAVGADNGDKWARYKLEYSADGQSWTEHASYTGKESGQDIVEVNFAGTVTARYVRLTNQALRETWLKFGEITIEQYNPRVPHMDQSEGASVTGAAGALTSDRVELTAAQVTLAPGAYLGVKLPRIRELVEIMAEYDAASGVILEAGANTLELKAVTLPLEGTLNARYIRLRNTGETAVTFALDALTARSREISGTVFDSATMGNRDTSQDARSRGLTGNVFDGNVTTSAKFCDTQVTDRYVLYDLGQTREIKDLQVIVQDQEKDYVRHGKVQIAMDKNSEWTDVITIDTPGGANTAALDAGWTAAPGYPNYVSRSGVLEAAQQARYLRIVFTDNFADRWLVLNEIIINSGEYVPSENNPNYVADPIEVRGFGPSRLFDGDITTGFMPNMAGRTAGSLLYRLSDETAFDQINLLQSSGAISHAAVEIRTSDMQDWFELGTLDRALNTFHVGSFDNILEIRLRWKEVQPTFYEMVLVPRGALPDIAVDTGRLEHLLSLLPVISSEEESGYDAALLAAYRAKYAAAEALLEATDKTQQAVNTMYTELAEIGAPFAKSLKDAKAVLSGVLETYAEPAYTPDSWSAYLASEAYLAARTALTGDSIQQAVHAVSAVNETAKAVLIRRADRTELNRLLEQSDALQASDYTADSYAAFQAELARIRKLVADMGDNLSQADADRLINELIAAKEALVRKRHSSSSAPSNPSRTETMPDGTTVTTVTGSDGTVTKTFKKPDGAIIVEKTEKNGTVTRTETAKDKVKTETVTKPKGEITAKVTLPSGKTEATVTIPLANPKPGYVAFLVNADGMETVIPKSIVTDKGIVLHVSASVTVKIIQNSKQFQDMNQAVWAKDAVDFVTARELFGGTGDGLFSPNSAMNRAMLVTVLHRLEGRPAATAETGFADVADSAYYAQAVKWAAANGIVTGTANGFEPEGTVTREQLVTILHRYAGSPRVQSAALTAYKDGASVSAYAVDAMVWAVQNGILTGKTAKTLDPQAGATRAEVAAILQRFMQTHL